MQKQQEDAACKAQEKEKLIHKRDEALKAAEQAKCKKRKKSSKSRNSTKFKAKLNLLANKLDVVDVDGLDLLDSDVNPVKAKHRKKEKQSEFDGYGIKKTPPEYFGIRGDGLYRHLKVYRNYHNKIVCSQFFKLDQLIKFVSGHQLARASDEDPAKEVHSIPDLFECLFLFSMFYLQLYPEKMLGFLDYCAHLSNYAHFCSPGGLVKIDAELHGWYVDHPENNWSQDNFEIVNIKTELAEEDSVKQRSN